MTQAERWMNARAAARATERKAAEKKRQARKAGRDRARAKQARRDRLHQAADTACEVFGWMAAFAASATVAAAIGYATTIN